MTIDQIIKKLLDNRGLTSQKAVDDFFHPPHPQNITSPFDSDPAIKLIKKHISHNDHIAIYGDYDVDGICSSAILWETLYQNYKHVFPHIPHRRDEGYGLSQKGIDHCLELGAKLIITVDNGITAHDQVKYCRDHSCDIIIIDHHEANGQRLEANCVLPSTSACAAGLTWFFCRDFTNHQSPITDHLSLVSLATICDLVPLLGINRSFAKFGFEELNKTKRPGLLALFKEAAIEQSTIQPYHVGFIIGPRLNAMGRLEHALDSLRLICTHDPQKAQSLAHTLNETNLTRQDLTLQAAEHALNSIKITNLLVTAHETYDEGIIGLVAAKLVEKHHRPAVAISVGEGISKGSARSISGFHITEHLRTASHLLINVGGHAMAAGFTIESSKITEFIQAISSPDISPELLVKKIRTDCEIPLSAIDYLLMTRLKEFQPCGLGNPTPTFMTKGVQISNIRRLGKLNQHLKFDVNGFEAIWFNSDHNPEPKTYNLSYQIDLNTWNGETKLQLVVKDLQVNNSPVTPS